MPVFQLSHVDKHILLSLLPNIPVGITLKAIEYLFLLLLTGMIKCEICDGNIIISPLFGSNKYPDDITSLDLPDDHLHGDGLRINSGEESSCK